jgi:hypothetical protein
MQRAMYFLMEGKKYLRRQVIIIVFTLAHDLQKIRLKLLLVRFVALSQTKISC